MKRRDFLGTTVLGGAAMLGASVWSSQARAVPFGQTPSGLSSSMLPPTSCAQNVLECFLLGGTSPWDTFYCVPGRGQANGTFAYADYAQLLKAAEGCGFETQNPFTPFGKDSAGVDVSFGPYLGKLLARPDVMRRLRVVINRHSYQLHEYAISLASTGRPWGSPSAAALGAHVARYFADRDPNRTTPLSYSFVNSADPALFTTLGQRPSLARPFPVIVGPSPRATRLLSRTTIGTTSEQRRHDTLLDEYFRQYAQRLRHGGEPVRAAAFDASVLAFGQQTHSDALRLLLPEADFQPLMTGPSCREVTIDSATGELGFASSTAKVSPSAVGNRTVAGLKLATQLLTNAAQPARHCVVVDAGVQLADGIGGYDSHSDGAWRQASNLNNLLGALLGAINEPGESDAAKLDLDRTLIILNTEFGRAPGLQGLHSGRNHWPHGYAQIYIGGPIREQHAGYYGAIDETGVATTFTTPAENRIAALLALGIYPFGADAFEVSDVQGQTEPGAAARSVIRRVLGHAV